MIQSMSPTLQCRLLLVACNLMLVTAYANATVQPNALFSDNAVLQRGIAVPVWGTAADGEKVTVTFQSQRSVTIAKNGKWMVRLKPLKAGGPFTMTIKGANKIELKNVLVGEVWICSGQSNMAFGLSTASNGKKAVASSTDPKLRLFTAQRLAITVPRDDTTGKWVESNPETSGDFSAVGYFFGRDLRRALKVPVGLIDAARGGTRIEAWTSADFLPPGTDAEEAKASMSKAKEVGWNKPSALYNGIIHPLIPYGLCGVIWYQGESNAYQRANDSGNAYDYRSLQPGMIRNWRADWGLGNFPFLIVQLAPFGKIVSEPQESTWAELREAQLLTSLHTPKTAMAVITDVGDSENIHPTRKEPVGARLALAARAIAYGEKVEYIGPTFKSIVISGNKAFVSFDHTGGGLKAKDGELKGFAIAGKDRVFHNAQANIEGNTISVSSTDVAKPVAVRYGWSDCPVVNLFSANGLPASPFRTDNFQVITTPKPAKK